MFLLQNPNSSRSGWPCCGPTSNFGLSTKMGGVVGPADAIAPAVPGREIQESSGQKASDLGPSVGAERVKRERGLERATGNLGRCRESRA